MHHPLSDGLIAQFRGEIPLPFFIAIMEEPLPSLNSNLEIFTRSGNAYLIWHHRS